MKNTLNRKKVLVRIIAVALLVFAILFVGCPQPTDDDDGGDTVPVLFHGYDNSSATMMARITAMSRSARGGDPAFAMPMAAPVVTSEYEEFYDMIGERVAGYTPDTFVMNGGIFLWTSDGDTMQTGTASEWDFAEGVNIELGEIPTGITCAAMVCQLFPYSLSFPKPSDLSVTTDLPSYYQNYGVTIAGGKVVFGEGSVMGGLGPAGINSNLHTVFGYDAPSDVDIKMMGAIIYGGSDNSAKFLDGDTIYMNDINSAWPHQQMSAVPNSTTLVVPFNGIAVPESARSVTFNVSWNLDGIIERYKGKDADNSGDDIFVLKEGWWNGLQISASVQ